MSLFSNWLKKDQGVEDPVGLDAAKKRILGEEEVPRNYIRRGTNPQIEGQPDLNQAIKSVQPQPTPQAKTSKPEPKKNINLDVDGDGDTDRDDVKQVLGNLRTELNGRVRGGKVLGSAQKIIERMDDPVVGKRINALVGKMIDVDKQRSNYESLNTFNDEEGALKFMTEGMGLVNDNGVIRQGQPNRELRALAGAGMPGEGRGEPRGISFREVQALLDPTRREILTEAQDDESGAGARTIHRNALKNDIPWDLATKLYDMLERGLQNKLDGWGKPVAEQGTFTPLGPVEFLKDGQGVFTGETNVDALAKTDPEEYKKHFGNNEGNRGRGIFNLMKHLSQGGMGEFSGLPTPFDFDGITPDHIGGRSSGALPNGRAKDDPLNLAFDRRGLNQFKVSSGKKGSPDSDTIKGMLKSAENVKGVLGAVGLDEEQVENLMDSPNFTKYLAYRLSQSDFDPDKVARRMGNIGIDSYPDSIEDFMNLDDDIIKALQSNVGPSNPLGLNMRNMAMRAPRKEQRELLPNTWGGAPGGGNEFYPLSGYRRAMTAAALYDPEIKRQLEEHEQSLKSQKRRKPLTDEKLEDEMSKKRRSLIEHNIFGPQKAIGTLFGLGAIDNEQYVQRLSDLATNKLGFLQESNPEAFERISSGLSETLQDYRSKLDDQFGDSPYQVTEDELMPHLDSSYMRAIMGSNYGRSMMPPSLVDAFDAIEKHSTYKDNLVDDLNLTLLPNTSLL